jgi:membrane-bound inhibitor of C-type lysozyme
MRLVLIAAGVMAIALAAGPVRAQTFTTYRCADGTVMPVVFHQNVANVQLDGKALRLPRRLLSTSGARFAAAGVTLRISRNRVSLKRPGGRAVACAAQ